MNDDKKRVLVQPRNLTNTFTEDLSIKDLQLSEGCFVQSHTVNRLLKLSLDCTTGSYQCKVTIPCVVPRVKLTYSYTFDEVPYKLGVVIVDVSDSPIDVTMQFTRDNNDKCTILNEIDDEMLSNYKVIIQYEEEGTGHHTPRVSQLMEQLTRKGWPYYTYKEEVKQFLFFVLLEIYNQEYRVFPDDQQLLFKQYCKSISIQP